MASALRFVPTCSKATKRPRRRMHLLRVRWKNISPSELDVESGVLAILARRCAGFYRTLSGLHDLLTTLPIHVDCAKAGLNSSPKEGLEDRKSTRLNSSHDQISYAVFCLKKKKRRVWDQPHHQ